MSSNRATDAKASQHTMLTHAETRVRWVITECWGSAVFALQAPVLFHAGCINVDNPVKNITSLPRLEYEFKKRM